MVLFSHDLIQVTFHINIEHLINSSQLVFISMNEELKYNRMLHLKPIDISSSPKECVYPLSDPQFRECKLVASNTVPVIECVLNK